MDRFGLIGYPVAHSCSPELFRKAYGGKYPYDLIETPDFEEAWETFVGGYRAVNVTAPFKEKAFRKVLSEYGEDACSAACREIGAANILVKRGGRVEAFNSDFLAVRKILSGLPGLESVLVVGFGGAGKAAAFAARSLSLEVQVCNRDTLKAPFLRPLSDIPSIGADVLIYTLPLAVEEVRGTGWPVVLEANYRNPALSVAGSPVNFRKYVPGTEWLAAQADTGYPIMTKSTSEGD